MEVGTEGLRRDNRTMMVPDPAQPNIMYDANDGGLFFSMDGDNTWNSGNADLQITEFQSITGSPITPGVIGGTQDNGTLAWNGPRVWDTRDDGDSASTIIDLADPAITMYDVYFGAEPRRSLPGGPCCNFSAITNGLFPN